MRSFFLAASLFATVSVPSAAAAQDDPRWAEAEERFEEADGLYERGDYEGALAEFLHVHGLLDGHPRRFFVLFNIGRCQEQLFRYDEALRYYERYLAEGRPGARAAGVTLNFEQETVRLLEELQRRLATLTITTNVDRAEVWVDDRLVGHAPGDVSVVEGRRTVELRAPGHAPSRQDVQVAARTTQTLTFSLESSFGGIHPALFLTGAALTVIAVGLGAGFGGAALAEQSNIDGQLASGDPRERFRVTQARIDANAQTALVADILYAVAGTLGIATLLLAFITDWGGSGSISESAGLTVAPFADSTSVGVSAAGRF